MGMLKNTAIGMGAMAAVCAFGAVAKEYTWDVLTHEDQREAKPKVDPSQRQGVDLQVEAARKELSSKLTELSGAAAQKSSDDNAKVLKIAFNPAFQAEMDGKLGIAGVQKRPWKELELPTELKTWESTHTVEREKEGIKSFPLWSWAFNGESLTFDQNATYGPNNPVYAFETTGGGYAYSPEHFDLKECARVREAMVVAACNTWDDCGTGVLAQKSTPQTYKLAGDTAYDWCVNKTGETQSPTE